MPEDSQQAGLPTDSIQNPGSKKNLSKSATRALDILEYFAMVGRPLRAVDIAQAFDFHTSSTDQLLKTLVDSAYLIFDSGKKLYYPSPRLVNFGSWLSANYFGEDRICRLLQSVHEMSGNIVTLSIRYGAFMQIVDVIEPLAQAGTIMKGLRVPITESIIGTAFLAAHSDKEVIRIAGQVTTQTGRKLSVSELKELLKRVNATRSSGYVSGPAVVVAEPWALAVALPPPAFGMTMVLGLAGDKASVRSREEELVLIIKKNINHWLNA